MKTITLNEAQANFLYGALEKAGYDIWDDPCAYGFEEEDWEKDEKGIEEEIARFKNEVCDEVLKQLK